jgi:hypothetical protein
MVRCVVFLWIHLSAPMRSLRLARFLNLGSLADSMQTPRVANLLNDWLSSGRYQQGTLAKKAGLTQLSLLRNGLRGMTREALALLLPALQENDRKLLLEQWLRDAIPDTFRESVAIHVDGTASESSRGNASGFPALDEALAILREHAPGSRELSQVITNLATMVREAHGP